MISDDQLARILLKHEALSADLSRPGVTAAQVTRLSKELAELDPVVATIRALNAARDERADLAALATDGAGDPEMRALAGEELDALAHRLPALERAVALALLPRDEADQRSAMLEIRAGTGGEEAALFARDLFGMYSTYAASRGWRIDLMSA